MPRRPSLPLASLALALLLVTAGCASLSGDTVTPTTDAVGTNDDVPQTDTTTDAEPTNADTTTGGASDGTSDESAVRASLVGTTATGVNLSGVDTAEQTSALAAALDVSARDVRLGAERGTLEVFDASVSETAIADALAEQGLGTDTTRIRPGVTDATQAATVRTLESRLNVLGIDATVEATAVDGRRGVVVIPADGNVSQVRDAVRDRGRVEIVAHFPANGSDDGARDVTLLANEDFERIGTAQVGQTSPYVPVTVTTDAAANFSSALVEFGFTGEGVSNCPTDAATADPANASGYCLLTVHDGEVVYAAGMSAGLANAMESGEWERDARFVMTAVNTSAARELQAHLEAGALPTRLALSD